MKYKLGVIVTAIIGIGAGATYYMRGTPGGASPEGVKFAPTTLSPMGAYSYPSSAATSSAPAQEVTAPTLGRLPPPLHPKAEEFARLTAAGATPAMLSKAYDYAKDCINERAAQRYEHQTTGNLLQIPPRVAQKCSLGEGDPTDVTWKRILKARVELNAYGAIADVYEARRTAFADDPEGWKRLRDEAQRNGLANAEPVLLGGESQAAYEEGDYRKAAVYAVASALGMAQAAGTTSDVLKDRRVAQAMAQIPADQQQNVINEGHVLARKWRKVS